MKEEAIGIFEGAVGILLVVSLFGGLMEFVILFGGMLAITSSVRVLRVRMEDNKKEKEVEA